MSTKTAKKTSSAAAAVKGKKVDVSFSSDSDDDEKSSSASSSSTSSSSSSSSSDSESDAPAINSKPIKPESPPPTTATISKTAASTATAEEDEEETVSFTLSLSTVHIEEPVTEEVQTHEEKIEPTTTTRQERKSKNTAPSPSPSPSPPPVLSLSSSSAAAAAVEEKREETKRSESPKKTPDAAVKPREESDATDTKKATTKKTSKAGTKSSRVDTVNGSEDADGGHSKMQKAEEKVSVQTEPLKKSTPVADDATAVVNGETKTTTKTVKKKTKKASTDSTIDTNEKAVTEEKPVVKEDIMQNEAISKTESSKTPATSTVEEAPVVVNGEPESKTKTVKKKVKKQTDSGPIVKEKEKEQETSQIKESTDSASKDKIIENDAKAEKSHTATDDADAKTVKEEPKPTAKTTIVKKKTKKAAGAVSSKTSDVQGDAIALESVTAAGNSSNKTADDAAKQKDSPDAEAEKAKSSAETKNTAASLDEDKNSASASATVGADRTVIKKKKVKKTVPSSTSPATIELDKTTTASEEPHVSKSVSAVDSSPSTAAGDVELRDKAADVAAVQVVTDSAHVESATVTSSASDAIHDSSAAKDSTVEETAAEPVTLVATSEETERSNIVTLIQLDNDVTEAPGASADVPVTVLSIETNLDVVEPTITHTADVDATDDSLQDSKNEESDFSYRRKSMDDFIKRILAEAREEQQKRMSTTPSSTSDSANLIDMDLSTNEKEKLVPSLSPTSTDSSMLDRRLASTDRKRMQQEEFGERTTRNAADDVDLDQDLAEIGRYFSKRNTTGNNRYDVEVVEKTSDLVGSRIRDIRDLDADTSKAVVNGLENRHRSQQNGTTEESFVPRAREETADVVRTSSRPVRAIIDQQTDVVQLLKSTSRGVDDLEAEIRGLRATFLDRQARIETLRNAIDAEVRAYHTDQQAANERIQQQQIPGGRFVRDEFMRANNIGPAYRSSAIEDLLGTSTPRRRSGSVSSTSGMIGGVGPSGMSNNDLDYQSSALNSWVRSSVGDQARRNNDLDDDASSTASGFSVARSRRGGSVVRERSYFGDDPVGSRLDTSRGYLLPSYDSASTSGYSYGSTLTSSYSPLTSSSLRSYYQNQTDYAPSSSSSVAAAAPYYSGRETRDYQLGNSDSTSLGYSPFRSSAINDPSRFRRAQSVSDFSSERSLGGDRYSAATSAGQFQSRFLDKVRNRKSQGEDQYRSRFLASDSAGPTSRYYSGRRGYSSND